MLGANLSSLFVGHWTAMLILYADAHPWDEVTMQGRGQAQNEKLNCID